MDIQIKNLNFNESMSEETPCFSCDVWKNGKKLATVKNHGTGGSNVIIRAKGVGVAEVEFLMGVDAEFEFTSMVEELHFVKKNQAQKFVLKKPNGKLGIPDYYTVEMRAPFKDLKKANPKKFKAFIFRYKQMYEDKGYIVLNTNLDI